MSRELPDEALKQFTHWLSDARAHAHIVDATAMSLATATKEGAPSIRTVLLKEYDAAGFVFYTNMESRKSAELTQNPHAALCFYWEPLGRQVRIEGQCERVADKDADAYFTTRPRISQLGAWASEQSKVLPSRETLLESVRELDKQYEGKPIPRPKHWSGWRLVPETIEFWQQGDFRLHQRERYARQKNSWKKELLYP